MCIWIGSRSRGTKKFKKINNANGSRVGELRRQVHKDTALLVC